jgi:type VI protein secretion system component Hcp
MEYTLANVICSSFTTSGTSASGSQPNENITLNFTSVQINQFLTDAAGNERAVRGGVDFQQNKSL